MKQSQLSFCRAGREKLTVKSTPVSIDYVSLMERKNVKTLTENVLNENLR